MADEHRAGPVLGGQHGHGAGRAAFKRRRQGRRDSPGSVGNQARPVGGRVPGLRGGARARARGKDWIELFIRNEKILSSDSEISRNFVQISQFLPIFCN